MLRATPWWSAPAGMPNIIGINSLVSPLPAPVAVRIYWKARDDQTVPGSQHHRTAELPMNAVASPDFGFTFFGPPIPFYGIHHLAANPYQQRVLVTRRRVLRSSRPQPY